MSASGKCSSTHTDSNESEIGECSFCAAPNPRDKIACHFCGSRLPWTFEAVGRFNLERKVYLNSLKKDAQPGVTIREINTQTVANIGPLPPHLIDTTVIQPVANPPIGKEVL